MYNTQIHASSGTSLPNLCASEFGAVLDGSPMINVDKGIESCRDADKEVEQWLVSLLRLISSSNMWQNKV